MNREQWLTQALDEFVRPLYAAAGYTVPERVRVTCGWPSKGGRSKVIGECWDHTCSADDTFEIFISPRQNAPADVLETLIHEAGHAVAGIDTKHGTGFRRVVTAVGLVGKMTATYLGDELAERVNAWLSQAPDYPHAVLDPKKTSKPKQGTRQRKVTCPNLHDGEEYIIRMTRKAIEQGLPFCGFCFDQHDEYVRLQEEEPPEETQNP